MERIARVLLPLCVVLAVATAITFDLPATTKRCLQEDVHKDILVVGEYEITDGPDQRVDLEVRPCSMRFF